MSLTNSVRAKLLGIVAMLSCVAGLLGVLGWYQMGAINDRLAYIVDHTSEAQILAARVRIYLTGIHRAEKMIILADSPDAQSKYEKSLQENETHMLGLLDQLERVATEKELSHISTFRRDYAAFKDASQEVIGLTRQDTDGQAARLSATRSEEIYRTIAEVIDEIEDINEEVSSSLLNEMTAGGDSVEVAEVQRLAQAFSAVVLTERIVQDLIDLLRAEKSFILAHEDSGMDAFSNAIEQHLTSVRDQTRQLEPLLDESGRSKLVTFHTRLADWTTLNKQIQSMGRASTRQAAARLSAGRGLELFQDAEAEMSAIIDLTDENMNTNKEESDAAYASATLKIVASAVIGVLAATTISVLLINKLINTLSAVVTRMQAVAAGDLTGAPIPVTSKDEIGELAKSTNDMQSSLRDVVSAITSNSEQVSAAATEVAATSEQMAASSDHQRAQLTQVAAAVEEMAATVTEVSGRTGEVSRQSTDAGNQATEGGNIVRRTVSEMGEIASQVESTAAAVGQLSEKAVQIGEILTVINDIADQTNLLALNAAIEAARAGEHGRGFAVVADEVRKLAERTQQATQEVSRSIAEIQASTGDATEMMGASKQRVSSGVELANQAGHSLENIVRGSTTVAQSIDSIAAAVEEQSATSAEIARSIEVISASADEATQGANQAAAAATQLSGNAESLRELVSRFRV